MKGFIIAMGTYRFRPSKIREGLGRERLHRGSIRRTTPKAIVTVGVSAGQRRSCGCPGSLRGRRSPGREEEGVRGRGRNGRLSPEVVVGYSPLKSRIFGPNPVQDAKPTRAGPRRDEHRVVATESTSHGVTLGRPYFCVGWRSHPSGGEPRSVGTVVEAGDRNDWVEVGSDRLGIGWTVQEGPTSRTTRDVGEDGLRWTGADGTRTNGKGTGTGADGTGVDGTGKEEGEGVGPGPGR